MTTAIVENGFLTKKLIEQKSGRDLISISPTGLIRARDLYDFLQIKSFHYSRWAKQYIVDNQFAAEGKDYEVLATNGETLFGGRPSTSYLLTIDFSKILCIVSGSSVGEQLWNYFREVEKRYQQSRYLPQMTQTQVVAAVAAQNVEFEKKMLVLESKINVIECETNQKIVQLAEDIRELTTQTPDDGWLPATVIAKKLNIISSHDNPHAQLVTYLARGCEMHIDKRPYKDDCVQVIKVIDPISGPRLDVYFSPEAQGVIEKCWGDANDNGYIKTVYYKRKSGKNNLGDPKQRIFEHNNKTFNLAIE